MIDNTLWLDRSINHLEKKAKGGLIMNTFRNKQFINELNPKYAFYDCLRSCELKSYSEKTFEQCIDSFDLKSSSDELDSHKTKNLNSIQN